MHLKGKIKQFRFACTLGLAILLGSVSFGQSVLLVSNSTSDMDYFQNHLGNSWTNNSGALPSFTTWDADNTPTLDYVENFDLVLLCENGIFGNASNIGNIVHEYVLGGGNLIIGTFYWQNRTGGVSGDWGNLESIDPLYDGACD